MHVNVRSVGVGRVGVCRLCVGHNEDRECGVGAGVKDTVLSETLQVPFVVYYESLKREGKTKPIHEFRCDERLQTKVEEFIRLACTD